MTQTWKGALLLLAVALMGGVHGDQGEPMEIPYSENPTVLRYYQSYTGLYHPVFALSRSYVAVPSWLPIVATWTRHQIIKQPTSSPSTMETLRVGLVVAKVCPPLKSYQAINMAGGSFYDFSSNITGSVIYISSNNQKLNYFPSTVMTDDDCANECASYNQYYVSPTQTCNAYAKDCSMFFDGSTSTYKAFPALMINGQFEAFEYNIWCGGASSEHNVPITYNKFGMHRKDIISTLPRVDYPQ